MDMRPGQLVGESPKLCFLIIEPGTDVQIQITEGKGKNRSDGCHYRKAVESDEPACVHRKGEGINEQIIPTEALRPTFPSFSRIQESELGV